MRVTKLLLALLLLPAAASAGGPRFVTGPPFFTGAPGQPIGWKQPKLTYFTDPGALSASVNHQAADALVLAAASVWNLPVASLTVGRGGALAEHVSGQNVYLDTSGMVFPADVMSANAAAIPIAVIYDSDGSVTDLLLGSGASQPASCRQNAVTESVDRFDPAGYILHAMLIVNGRCTGGAPALQLELQYQLMRAFGRVLGLAWSQTNDNVFTGTPTPTYNQALNWPIMHPLDILCGPYAYQCLPNPFQLRADDIAAMAGIYPAAASLADAHAATGHVSFPTGEGMAGVNVLVRREPANGTVFDGWYETSAVTGALFRSTATSPFVAAGTDAFSSFGSTDAKQLGAYLMPYVPIEDGDPWQNIAISTEAVNPLYTGTHGLAPYFVGTVAPSGAAPVPQILLQINPGDHPNADVTIADAAPVCGNGADGTPQSPMPVPATGWWNGLLCGYAHASYAGLDVVPGRTFTLEVTALDEQGIGTTTKAMPVLGVFAPTDQPGDLPSLAVAPTAFQANALGTTSVSVSTGQLTSLWFGIADERNDGRPDFHYQARFFYAANVLPAQLPLAGGQIILQGMGFRAGNAVTINGVAVTVVSWSANSIVVTAPSSAVAKATSGVAVDIEVRDLSTGASSTMSSALTYTSATQRPNVLSILAAPAGIVYVGDVAVTPFAVQLTGPDGVTPVAGASIVFSIATGSAQFSGCSAMPCTLVTDANGKASTTLTPQSAGSITLQAAAGALTQSATFTALAQTGGIDIWYAPAGNQPEGQSQLLALVDFGANNIGGLAGRSVTLSATQGSVVFSACGTPVCTLTTAGGGSLGFFVTPTSIGPITIQAADGDITAKVSFVSVNSADTMVIATRPFASSYVDDNSGAFGVTLLQADGVTPDTLETVTFTAPAGVVLYPCVSNVCAVSTGWTGTAGVGITGRQPGVYTLTATYGTLSQSVTITVLPHTQTLTILSVPSGSVPVNTAAATPFSAQLLQDGVRPLSGLAVTLSGSQGQVALSGCANQAGCLLITGANGVVSSPVIPLVPGVIGLTAVYQSTTETASFTAIGAARTMTIVVQPGAAGVQAGDNVQVSVQVTGAGPGGAAPLANEIVTFTIVSGPFGYTDWYQSSVGRFTDATGTASEFGIAGAAGIVTLLASDGVVSQTITFAVSAKPGATVNDTLTALNPQTWISEGATLSLMLKASADANGSAVAGQAVQWTAGPGFQAAGLNTATDRAGIASAQVVLGPLAAGSTATMSACAWTNICAAYQGTGVALAAQSISVVSGGLQSVTGLAATAPVVVQVFDSAGHPVAAAPVNVYQTVRAWTAACPQQGRCPAAPILASQATVQVSGLDGTVTVQPLAIAGTSTQTELAFSAGTNGFATTVVANQP